eukprot:7094035-Pyramimonas_sp.AAC.1
MMPTDPLMRNSRRFQPAPKPWLHPPRIHSLRHPHSSSSVRAFTLSERTVNTSWVPGPARGSATDSARERKLPRFLNIAVDGNR